MKLIPLFIILSSCSWTQFLSGAETVGADVIEQVIQQELKDAGSQGQLLQPKG